MINSSLKEKYWDSGTDKQMVISIVGTNQKIDNSMLEVGTFALEESLCSESELKFGACEANCVKFTARNTAGSIAGKTISIEETIDGDSENPMPYGVFKTASDVPTADRTKRQITAYDAMYDIINADVKAWYAGLSFPMALKQFRYSFFAYLGVEQEETTLVNDSMTVNKTLIASSSEDSSVTAEATISGKTIIEAICEINGAFGNMNRAGKFEYVILPSITSALYPADDLYPRDDLFPSDANTESMTGHYFTFDYEDFQSKAITQLEIRADDNTAGAIVGNPGNTYVISGNFLVSDKTGAELEQIANNVLPIMAQAAYTPIKSCTTVGNPCLELGDPIRFNTSREIVETYLLQRTLTGVQSKRDSIVAQGTPTHSAKVNSIRDTIENVERRTGKLERNADHLQSTYEDLEEQTSSKFEQTADAIQTEVTNRQNADSEMSTKISQTAHSIGLTATGGEKSVGIVIQLYDENGNIIDTSSDNANIQITGVVTFNDLAQSGSTTINGDNITTGTIRGTNSEFTNVKFLENVYYRYQYSGQLYDYPIFNVDQLGILDFCGRGVHVNFGGSWLFKDSRVYLRSMASNNQLATIGDITVTGFSGDSTAGVYNSIHMSGTVIDGSKISYDDLKKKLSDKRLKKDISSITDSAIEDFYMNLTPARHKYKNGVGVGEDGKYQFGVIAQWTEKDMIDHDINPDLYSIVQKSKPLADTAEAQYTGGDDVYRVDYDQFHALHIYMIQKQQKEIEELKLDNFSLKGEVDILKQRLGKMEEMLNVINSKIN
mgnify:CR=1 FL=1|nr:MAG TPA: Endo-N-acetylneuraminidase [Bacteriophage sp.]